MKVRKKGYGLLLGLTAMLTLAAISTVLPSGSVDAVTGASSYSKWLLGYGAHCTFAPISTVICIVAAGAVCAVRKHRFTERA